MDSQDRPNQTDYSPLPNRTRYVLLCSGREHVGKSSICTNLAIALARQDRQVCILDTDSGLTNIHRLLGLAPQHTLADVAADDCTIRDAISKGPADIQLLLDDNYATTLSQQPLARQVRFKRQVVRFERDIDYLLIDTSTAQHTNMVPLLELADALLLVLIPDPQVLSETFLMLSELGKARHAKTIHMVVNRAASETQAQTVFAKFSRAVSKYLGCNILYAGHIGRDENIRNGFALQHPVAMYSESDPSCAGFFKLAQTLEAQLPAPRPAHPGLCGWLPQAESQPAASDTTAPPVPQVDNRAQGANAKQQFMHMPNLADELIDDGLLNGEELKHVVDRLSATGRHEFPAVFSPVADKPSKIEAVKDDHQQSLLGLLQQNRSSGKTLDEMLQDFLGEKH